MRRLSRQVLIVTPHLGDAVLGCGELLAAHPGAVVLTAFAGIPTDAYVVPEWDAACGFSSPRQAVTVRRREERRALEILDAEPCWLSCPESQYRRKVTLEDTVLRLARALRRHRAELIAVPLGLVPGDHRLTCEAALQLAQGRDCEWLLYDDSVPGGSCQVLDERLARFEVEPLEVTADPYQAYLKRRAVESYDSLQRGFRNVGRDLASTLQQAERYWRVPARRLPAASSA
jgi:LmbE family N-acetylglucosaminyl deacetylase